MGQAVKTQTPVQPAEKATALTQRLKSKQDALMAAALETYRDHVTRAVAGTDTPDDSELDELVDSIRTLGRLPADFDSDVALAIRVSGMEKFLVDSNKREMELETLCEKNTKDIESLKARISELDS